MGQGSARVLVVRLRSIQFHCGAAFGRFSDLVWNNFHRVEARPLVQVNAAASARIRPPWPANVKKRAFLVSLISTHPPDAHYPGPRCGRVLDPNLARPLSRAATMINVRGREHLHPSLRHEGLCPIRAAEPPADRFGTLALPARSQRESRRLGGRRRPAPGFPDHWAGSRTETIRQAGTRSTRQAR